MGWYRRAGIRKSRAQCVGGLISVLRGHRLVGIDTSVFIYHIEGGTPFTPLATDSLEHLARGAYRGVTSSLTIMELTVKPYRLGQLDIAAEYEALLEDINNLSIVDLDRPIIRHAAQLRARHHLRPADALQVAACLHGGATAFLTNDQGIRRIAECEIMVLGSGSV
ncbi:MAG: type II toxin-antitoxin system VapC family toxin [Thermomicrobiales bacterium]